MQKDRHIAVWLRLLAEKEVGTARSAKKYLKVQSEHIASAYANEGQSAVEQIINEAATGWAKILVATYTSTIKTFASYINDQLTTQNSKASFMDIVQGFIAREAFKKSKLITQTTMAKAKEIISDGVKNGHGEKEIAKNLSDGIGGAVADSRARTIARTEVHNAASYGMQAAAEEIDRPMIREWVAVEDERTRPAHAEADGQQRGMEEPFDVGGEELDYPGDGSDENSINCRCTLIYIPKDATIEGDGSGEFI